MNDGTQRGEGTSVFDWCVTQYWPIKGVHGGRSSILDNVSSVDHCCISIKDRSISSPK